MGPYYGETGGLNVNRNNEKLFALIAWIFDRAHRKDKVEYKDYLMFTEVEEEEATLESVFNLLKSVSKKA